VAAILAGAGDRITEGERVLLPVTPLALPQGWLGCSINESPQYGAAVYDSATGEITLRGAGGDIAGIADECYFMGRLTGAQDHDSGDFRITVQALPQPRLISDWSRAGVMIRESLAPGARRVYLNVTRRYGLNLGSRIANNLEAENEFVIPHAALRLPITLRLTRRGNTLLAHYSQDGGRTFQPAGDPRTFSPPLAKNLYAGLAITAADATQYSQARFRDLSIEPRE
jgi:hypothetical protein